MRKYIAIIILLLATRICLAQEQKFPFVGIVTREGVNVRSGPNLNFEITSKLNKSDKIIILSQSYRWYKIRLPKTANCYVNKKYIKIYEGQSGFVLVDRLNIRTKPKEKSDQVGQLRKNEVIKILGKASSDWYKIKPPKESYGWIDRDLIKYFSDYNKDTTLDLYENNPFENKTME